jgi:hypothetical protein
LCNTDSISSVIPDRFTSNGTCCTEGRLLYKISVIYTLDIGINSSCSKCEATFVNGRTPLVEMVRIIIRQLSMSPEDKSKLSVHAFP